MSSLQKALNCREHYSAGVGPIPFDVLQDTRQADYGSGADAPRVRRPMSPQRTIFSVDLLKMVASEIEPITMYPVAAHTEPISIPRVVANIRYHLSKGLAVKFSM